MGQTLTNPNLPEALSPKVARLLAFCAPLSLAESGTAMSLPSRDGTDDVPEACFAIAFGSNFPVYSDGDASLDPVAGDWGDATAGDKPDLLSISFSMFRAPPVVASSRCLRSRSAACFCFQASNFASRSAFFSSSVCAAEAAGVETFEACPE